VAEDAGDVHERVEATELLDRGRDDPAGRRELRHGVVARGGLAAGRADLVDDLIRRLRLLAAAVDRTAEVVHDDRRAFRRHQDRDAAADAAARARHDDDLPFEIAWHGPAPRRAAARGWTRRASASRGPFRSARPPSSARAC